MDAIGQPFRLEEHDEPDDSVRLSLIGELDVAAAPALNARLRALGGGPRLVRLDLRALNFIDSTGLRELVTAVSASQRDGWPLVIEGELTSQVRRLVDLSGYAPLLWPEHSENGESAG